MSDQNDFSLPPNWAWAELGDLVEVIRGVTYNKVDARSEPSDGLIPILRATNVADRLTFDELVYVPEKYVSEEQFLRLGDIVVVASSGSRHAVGRAALFTGPWKGSFGAFCFALRPRPEVASHFLALFLQTTGYRRRISELSAGVNINNLKVEHIKKTAIPVAPQAEQSRIVSEIEKHLTRLDSASALLKKIQAHLKRYRAAALKEACEGRLVPTEAELADKEGRPVATTRRALERLTREQAHGMRRNVPSPADISTAAHQILIPEGWAQLSTAELLRSGALLDVKDGNHGTNHPKRSDFTSEGLPFVTAEHVNYFRIDYTATPKLSGAPLAKLRVGFAEPGDVVLTHKGSVGRVSVCERRCVLSPQSTYYRVHDKVIHHRYLMYYMASPQFASQLAEVKSQTTRDYVPISNQYKLSLLLPPLSEQVRIAKELDRQVSVINRLSELIDNNLQRGEAFRKSILSLSFEGRLVPQDSNDEPASALLERIRQAKHQQNQDRSTRRRSPHPAPEGHPNEVRGVHSGDASPIPPHEPRRGDVSDSPAVNAAPGLGRLAKFRTQQQVAPAGLKKERAQEEPTGSFTDLPSEDQIDAVWESLLGRGTLEKEDAVRAAAETLRDRDLARFTRLRQGGALYEAIEAAIGRGLRTGDFDRPKRGHVRAVLSSPRDYSPEIWSFCLLESFDHQVVEEGETFRAAAEWARENMGLEYGRLREDGTILRGLRTALEEAIRRGDIERIGRKQIRRT